MFQILIFRIQRLLSSKPLQVGSNKKFHPNSSKVLKKHLQSIIFQLKKLKEL